VIVFLLHSTGKSLRNYALFKHSKGQCRPVEVKYQNKLASEGKKVHLILSIRNTKEFSDSLISEEIAAEVFQHLQDRERILNRCS
jgi:hypothetical protein